MPCRCADDYSLLEVLPAVGGWRWEPGRRDAAPGSARTSSTLGTAAPGPVVRVLLVLSLPIN